MYGQSEVLDPEMAIDADLNEILTQERGWSDVCAGLTRILLGWGVLVAGIAMGIGLLVLSVFLAKPTMYWAFFGGLAMLGMSGFFSWSVVLAGLLRCALHSPERNGVRWFIFVCMLCVVIGPILNIGSSLICNTHQPEFDKGIEGLKRFEVDSTGRFVQAASMVGAVGYNIAFILFIRGIACCFRSLFLLRLADAYMAFYIGLLGTTVFLVFFRLTWLVKNPQIALMLAVFYLLQFAFYVALVILARSAILSNLRKVRTTMGQAVFAMD